VGTYKLEGEDTVIQTVISALQLGYRHIGVTLLTTSSHANKTDTARIYKNEKLIGEALNRSGVPRDQIFITSKLSPYEMT
jgi:diketogulonate reductase-like aldo/keto reductase